MARGRASVGSTLPHHTVHRRCVNIAVAHCIIAEVGPAVLRSSYRRLEPDHEDILSKASLRVLEGRCIHLPLGYDPRDFVRGTATRRVEWLAHEFIENGSRGAWGVSCDEVDPPVGGAADRAGLEGDGEEKTPVGLSDSAEDEAMAALHVLERVRREGRLAQSDARAWAAACHDLPPRLAWGKATRRALFEAVFTERLATLAASSDERALWRRGDHRLVAWRGLALADPVTFGAWAAERPPKGSLGAAAEQDLYGGEPRLAARLVAALDAAYQRHLQPVASGSAPGGHAA